MQSKTGRFGVGLLGLGLSLKERDLDLQRSQGLGSGKWGLKVVIECSFSGSIWVSGVYHISEVSLGVRAVTRSFTGSICRSERWGLYSHLVGRGDEVLWGILWVRW